MKNGHEKKKKKKTQNSTKNMYGMSRKGESEDLREAINVGRGY